jgi:hypothetical protein
MQRWLLNGSEVQTYAAIRHESCTQPEAMTPAEDPGQRLARVPLAKTSEFWRTTGFSPRQRQPHHLPVAPDGDGVPGALVVAQGTPNRALQGCFDAIRVD